jgi:hypothetical protein
VGISVQLGHFPRNFVRFGDLVGSLCHQTIAAAESQGFQLRFCLRSPPTPSILAAVMVRCPINGKLSVRDLAASNVQPWKPVGAVIRSLRRTRGNSLHASTSPREFGHQAEPSGYPSKVGSSFLSRVHHTPSEGGVDTTKQNRREYQSMQL